MADRKNTDTSQAMAAAMRDGMHQSYDQMGMLQSLAMQHGQNIAQSMWESTRASFQAFHDMAPGFVSPRVAQDYQDYLKDSADRAVLFAETLYRRGNNALDREEEGLKPVLAFDYEMIVDGRALDRPVNYSLVRITPPEGFPPQREDGRPWVIIDPRAGHGSGIGGFKSESEVGVALRDGHPVYFVIFYPEPEPGQTLADVTAAEALFMREVRSRHPAAPRPLVTGNCQGGWASMILAATHPDLTGPVIIAGAPLSYWAGEVGKNPFRYLGGVMGGAVPALMASDLGGGKFDGASLVYNFETLNPARTWWRKNYDLFADDKGAKRFLDFERWWSGFYFMNEAEIRWIVENLFVGNKLTRGQAVLDDGTPIDLTRIEAPVVVFASHGDNITPPQQALNWIPDLYGSIEELRAKGHVIVYTLHDSIGHLGIFVSAQVASKQHKQITSVVKTIEALPPGLYEMQIEKAEGVFHVSFEGRTIDDILKLDDGREEEKEFAAVAKFSEWAVKTYELTWRPILKAMITPEIADKLRETHPMRSQIQAFSRKNPLLDDIGERAEEVRANRTELSDVNPFPKLEAMAADAIEANWNLFRDVRDAWIEMSFHTLYGTPWMKAYAQQDETPARVQTLESLPQVREVLQKASQGGYSEAIIRMLILLARARGSVRRERLERSNAMMHSRPPFDTMSEEDRSRLIHEQTMIVDFAGKEAINALPEMLRDDVDRIRALDVVLDIAGPLDEMDAPTIAMFKHLQTTLMTMAQGWRDPEHELSAHEPGRHARSEPMNKAAE
ncbi:DUF3141 domain-containing protein [Oricola sp.]|uniref:DUF3141 domain-containing protein n=1 Tax=Oricola sp. TaxID=1979950 RepID=UPI003BAAEB6A